MHIKDTIGTEHNVTL